MVHSKLIAERKVVPLTFQQLRKLERIDAKKEREAKLLEIAKEGVVAGGQIGRGIFQGTITGPIALGLVLTATYPGWLPIIEDAAAALAKAIANAWKNGIVPGTLGQPPLVVPPTAPGPSSPKTSTTKYCIRVWRGALNGGWAENCWATEGERNGAYITALAAGNQVQLEDPITTTG